ncbi:MAG: Crp/Fnr family transcriptional regulator [Cyclobacteriaceae bacterium]
MAIYRTSGVLNDFLYLSGLLQLAFMSCQPLFDYMSRHIELTNEERLKIESLAKVRNYLKGQYVLQQGDVCKYENFVAFGCLKAFHADESAQEHIIMFAIEDWWVSDLGSLLNQTPSDFNIQCLENSQLIQFSSQNLETLYHEVPKIERLFRILTQKAFVASWQRIIRGFSLSAKERYLKFRELYPQIEQRVPQYMIASYLGITKEFLSKIRSQLAE